MLAFGQKIKYNDLSAELLITNKYSAAVTVIDYRSEIQGGTKKPEFVGLLRGGYGNTFDIITESKNSLADDFNSSLTLSLKNRGLDVESVKWEKSITEDKAIELLKNTNKDRLILLTIKDWKTDAYMKAGFEYNFKLTIFDNKGNLLVEKKMGEKENIGGSFNIVKYLKTKMPLIFIRKIEDIFNQLDVLVSMGSTQSEAENIIKQFNEKLSLNGGSKGYSVETPGAKKAGILVLMLGIFSLIFSFVPVLGVIWATVSMIITIISKKKNSYSTAMAFGFSFVIAGIIITIFMSIMYLVIFISSR